MLSNKDQYKKLNLLHTRVEGRTQNIPRHSSQESIRTLERRSNQAV
jgi:hypothetical protein